MNNLISVIIPTYKRPDMLREAILSVKAQDYPFIEIIVIDDCSGDNTKQVVDEFPDVQYYCNDINRGPGYNRKLGLIQSHGKYIVFIDDDDYYISYSFLSNAVKKLNTNSDYAFVASCAKSMDTSTGMLTQCSLNVQGEMSATEYLSGFSFRYNVPLTFATVFNRRHLETCGVFEMTMVNHMPMIMRCLQFGKVFFLNDFVGVYRKHPNNISNSLNPSFLIDNLQEKYEMFEMIKSKQLFNNYDDWWLEQIKKTTSYYVYESHPKLNEIKKVQFWCMNRFKNKEKVAELFAKYRAYLIDYRICTIKCKLKKVLGMK